MRKKLAVLALGMVGTTGWTIHAATTGVGVPRPFVKPISIREGSARGPLRAGHHRTRYFMGGGLHRGK